MPFEDKSILVLSLGLAIFPRIIHFLGSSTFLDSPIYSILQSKTVKSTYYGQKEPILVDFEGNVMTDGFQFRFGVNTEVYGSCPVVFQGQSYIFGGGQHTRQVSHILYESYSMR